MPVALDYPQTCVDCGQRMFPGEVVHFSSKEGGGYEYCHVDCPPPPENTKGQNLAQRIDPEELFITRKCAGECKNLTSFRKGGRITPSCPYCGGGWVRGNPDELAWAC